MFPPAPAPTHKNCAQNEFCTQLIRKREQWYNFYVMATRKPSPPKSKSKSAARSKTAPEAKTAPATKSAPTAKSASGKSPEYRAYEKRHANLGEERPKLTQAEFEQYEDELLDLLAINDREMSDDQIVRIQEIEYLIIDAE